MLNYDEKNVLELYANKGNMTFVNHNKYNKSTNSKFEEVVVLFGYLEAVFTNMCITDVL